MQLWSQASALAARTPQERNRYIDFLRALSILIVIAGHWLIATSYYVDGKLISGHLLQSHPQTEWLTWIFQVMPIFFIVGGYSNALSLESARRRGVNYAEWLSTRLNRLIVPLLALVICWAAISAVMHLLGADQNTIVFASQASLIPTWFLAIYIMAVILAPASYRFWKRFGFISLLAFVLMALLIDAAFFIGDLHWLGWANYFPVWLAVHHLGYAWRDGRIEGTPRLLVYSALGLLTLSLLVSIGPYPFAMVGFPDKVLSNTTPPKVTLLALSLFQFGLLRALEAPMKRALCNLCLWTLTVLVNSMIMTIYLWHITVMILFIALLFLAGGPGLGIAPGSPEWWFSRPLWIVLLLILLLPVAMLLSPLERYSRAKAPKPTPLSRQIGGAVLVCSGIALLARFGFGGGPLPKMDIATFALITAGAWIGGILPGLRWPRSKNMNS